MFTKAERSRVFLKLGLMGASGSGKTYSALLLAKGIAKGGKIAVIDTENGSASLYSDLFEFDVCNIGADSGTAKYIEAIEAAEAAGYAAIVIDSFTHPWKHLLDQKEKLDARQGRQNHYTNWGPIKAEADKLKGCILQSKIHVICCMRAKAEYLQEDGKVKKVGLAAIQEPDVEYEFTTVFQLAMDHNAKQTKDRTGIFGERIFTITEKTGEELSAWLDSAPEQGTYTPEPKPAEPEAAPTQEAPKGEFSLRDWVNSMTTPLTQGELKKLCTGAGKKFSEVSRHAYEAGVDNTDDFIAFIKEETHAE